MGFLLAAVFVLAESCLSTAFHVHDHKSAMKEPILHAHWMEQKIKAEQSHLQGQSVRDTNAAIKAGKSFPVNHEHAT